MRLFLALLFVCGFLTNTAVAQNLRPATPYIFQFGKTQSLIKRSLSPPTARSDFRWQDTFRLADVRLKPLKTSCEGGLPKIIPAPLTSRCRWPRSIEKSDEETKPRVYITGEVLRPGPVPLQQKINVVQAIAMAGGLGPFAARQRIQLHRKIDGANSIFVFDYNAYLSGNAADENITLRSGDIIIVPERGLLE